MQNTAKKPHKKPKNSKSTIKNAKKHKNAKNL